MLHYRYLGVTTFVYLPFGVGQLKKKACFGPKAEDFESGCMTHFTLAQNKWVAICMGTNALNRKWSFISCQPKFSELLQFWLKSIFYFFWFYANNKQLLPGRGEEQRKLFLKRMMQNSLLKRSVCSTIKQWGEFQKNLAWIVYLKQVCLQVNLFLWGRITEKKKKKSCLKGRKSAQTRVVEIRKQLIKI